MRAVGDEIQWVGERVLHEAAVAPALLALERPELAGARTEYEEATRLRRQGHPRALETSLLRSGKAVEAALKALLVAYNKPLPQRETAVALWNRAVENGLILGMWQNAVLAASGPRNEVAHTSDAGTPPVTEDDAEAALAAAGLAIRLLGAALPPDN
jgi:HEPN domain-containing protein